jgi:hypothetical protein
VLNIWVSVFSQSPTIPLSSLQSCNSEQIEIMTSQNRLLSLRLPVESIDFICVNILPFITDV